MLTTERCLRQLLSDLGESMRLAISNLHGIAEIGLAQPITPIIMRELLKAHTLVEELSDFSTDRVLDKAIEEAKNRASLPELIEAKQGKGGIKDSRLDRVTGSMQRIVLEYIPTSLDSGYYLLKLVKNGVNLISFVSIPDKPSIVEGRLQCNNRGASPIRVLYNSVSCNFIWVAL